MWGPSISFSVTTPTGTSPQSATISYCDDTGLNQSSQQIWLNGTSVTSNFSWTPTSECEAAAQSQGSLNLQVGTNWLKSRICDYLSFGQEPSPGPFCTTDSTSIYYRPVTVTPDGFAVTKEPSRPHTQKFAVQNTGASSQQYTITVSCSGAGVSGCSAPGSVTVGAGATDSVAVSFSTGSLGQAGSIVLRATMTSHPTVFDEGSVNVTVGWVQYLTADFGYSNNDNQISSVCANACFAVTASVSTVPYISLDQPRSISLVYNGDRVAVRPFVYADVKLNPGAYSLDQLQLELVHQTQPNPHSVTFLNGETKLQFRPGDVGTKWVRLGGQFDALTNNMPNTGVYPVQLIARARYDTLGPNHHVEERVLTTKILVVNERKSPIARGWTIAGLQRLYPQTQDGSAVITSGDGSAVHFASCGTGCFTSPSGEFTTLTSTGSGENTVYTRATIDSTKSYFDHLGRLTHMVTRAGDTTSFEYDGLWRVTRVYDPFRRAGGVRLYTAIRYGPPGISQIEEPGPLASESGGRITQIVVAPDSTLTSFADPDGFATTFGYDALRRLRTVTDRRGGTRTFAYAADSSWKLASVTLPTIPIDNGNGSTIDGAPVSTFTAWQTVSVPYHSTSQTTATPVIVDSIVGTVTDPRNHVTKFTVDRWGQPLRTIDPLGHATVVQRQGLFATRVTHPTGAEDTYWYSGPQMTMSQPAGSLPTYFTYGAYGQVNTISGNGPQRTFSIGARGHIDAVTVANATTVYKADAFLRDTAIIDPQNHKTTFRYDSRFGNRDSTHRPDGQWSAKRFDGHGRDSVLRAAHVPNVVRLYDSLNRVVRVYDGVHANPTIFEYDALFNTRVHDPKGQVFEVHHNALGWVTRRYDPGVPARYVAYTYTADGLTASVTNRHGDRIDFSYDSLHRLRSKQYPTGAEDSFAYSTDGRVGAAISRISSDTTSIDSTFASTTGWVDSVVTRMGGQRFRRYFTANVRRELDSLAISSTTSIDFRTRRWSWNGFSPTIDSIRVGSTQLRFRSNGEFLVDTTIFPGSLKRIAAYTQSHQLQSVNFNVSQVDMHLERTYGYDSLGRRTSDRQPLGAGSRTRRFLYTGLGELREFKQETYSCMSEPPYWCYPGTESRVQHYYDAAGNDTLQKNVLTSVSTVSRYRAGNRDSLRGTTTYSVDEDGNRIQKSNAEGVTTYTWTADGKLAAVARGSTTIQYAYNAFGQLVRRSRNGVIDRYFLWDGNQLLAELDGTAASRVAEYAYYPGVDHLLAVITGNGGSSAMHFVEQDANGNVIGLFDSTGTRQSLRYDPWGKLDYVSTTLPDTVRLRWKGLRFESDIVQLYYARARWYDPENHRFLSEDPAGALNQYVFAGSDPVNMVDPSGAIGYRGPCSIMLRCGGSVWDDWVTFEDEWSWSLPLLCTQTSAESWSCKPAGPATYYIGGEEVSEADFWFHRELLAISITGTFILVLKDDYRFRECGPHVGVIDERRTILIAGQGPWTATISFELDRGPITHSWLTGKPKAFYQGEATVTLPEGRKVGTLDGRIDCNSGSGRLKGRFAP